MNRLNALCLLILFPFSITTVFGAEPAPIEIGRRGEAIPWLDKVQDVPYMVVDYASIPLLANFPQRTNHYEIDPQVVVSGYSYFFYVRSAAGDFLVGSMGNLSKLCHELAVLQQIKEMNKGKEFAEGVGDAVVGIGTGLGNLVTHPGQSLSGFGHRIRMAGRSVERAVGGTPKVGQDERGIDRSNLGAGPAGGQRRQIAAELGIDVYTDNPVLKKALTELSQIKAAGGFVTWAIPYNIGLLANFNPLSGDEATEQLIRDFDPYELRRQVGENLERLLNQDREGGQSDLSRLLLNPNYTPREIAYIGKDLTDMAAVAGLDLVLRILVGADSPERADFLSTELRLYSFYHRHIAPLQSFQPYLNMFAAIDSQGGFNGIFAVDTVRPWYVNDDALEMMIQEALKLKVRALTIWILGDVDATVIEKARARNVTIRQNIMLDKTFFPGREQMR